MVKFWKSVSVYCKSTSVKPNVEQTSSIVGIPPALGAPPVGVSMVGVVGVLTLNFEPRLRPFLLNFS